MGCRGRNPSSAGACPERSRRSTFSPRGEEKANESRAALNLISLLPATGRRSGVWTFFRCRRQHEIDSARLQPNGLTLTCYAAALNAGLAAGVVPQGRQHGCTHSEVRALTDSIRLRSLSTFASFGTRESAGNADLGVRAALLPPWVGGGNAARADAPFPWRVQPNNLLS